ncbi:hemocyanin B chain-like [Panulirus ornatus]|uniref:hemocyanin B chain-like n=1 Tax=Panulirus ornatus TaxID=150431 RepID=UPI003A88DAFC
MKVLVLCVLVAAAAAWPSFSEEIGVHFQNDAGGSDNAHKQQDINHLLDKIYEPTKYPDLKEIAENFNPVGDTSIYNDQGAAAETLMKELTDHRLLEKHHWFSLFNTRQREEALMLFAVLNQCKEWYCFRSNAAYFREQMNEGEFVYALYVGVIHSKLGDGIVLPPLYEITPHMFTNSEVIDKAYSAKMTQRAGTFDVSFTGTRKNKEQRVAYFGEDIGMNIHHVTWHMDFPFWWQDSYGYHLDRKGELFFWVHHQLTARFDSERLSNWMDPVDELHWDDIIHEGFAPLTSYKYGGEFPVRPDNIHFEDVDGVARVHDMEITESRIRDAIAHGYITATDGHTIDIRQPKGIEYLGDIIESSMYSSNARYYGSLHNTAHVMLGRQGDPHGKFNLPPGVMEHFETATRDPSFFRLHKYMDNIFKEHTDSFPPYTHDDLVFDGVSVDSITIDGHLTTFFDDFQYSLINAVDSGENIEDVEINARVHRLNHEEFDYKITVNNNHDDGHLATIRIFLCPIKDNNGITLSIDEARWLCLELDKFWEKLPGGTHTITRSSKDSSVTVPDMPSFQSLKQQADDAVTGGHDLDLSAYERSCGIPDRMLLPKSKPQGMEFNLYVAVTDGAKDTEGHSGDLKHGGTHAQCGVHGEDYPDNRPLGYPLERRIPDERVIDGVPNIKHTVVTIVHDPDHHA